MPSYTLIMEYAGGTYVSQLHAASPKSACVKWAQGLDVSQVCGLGRRSQESLIAAMREEVPIPLGGLSNVWCATTLIRGKLALINIVRTERGKKAPE
jgi:hypothetical protein